MQNEHKCESMWNTCIAYVCGCAAYTLRWYMQTMQPIRERYNDASENMYTVSVDTVICDMCVCVYLFVHTFKL